VEFESKAGSKFAAYMIESKTSIGEIVAEYQGPVGKT
jgi:hypothetical protein